MLRVHFRCDDILFWVRIAIIAAPVLALAGCTNLSLAIANAPTAFDDLGVHRDVQYAEASKSQVLDLYVPKDKDQPHPVVMFLHGGGWTSGSKNQYRFVAEALLGRGYVVVVPGYRLYPETRFPGFIEDAAQAVAWTQAHVAEFGGDPDRLFLMGHSAGAHIAAMLNFDEKYLREAGLDRSVIKGFIGLAGPYDFLPLRSRTLQKVFAPEERYADSQPVNFVDGEEPPALLLHGLADFTVGSYNSKHLAARIRQVGGKVEEHYYDGMSHGGVLAAVSVYFRNRRSVLDEIGEFVEREGYSVVMK